MSLERITSKKISTVLKNQQRQSQFILQIAEMPLEISQVLNLSSFIFIERNASCAAHLHLIRPGHSEGSVLL